MPLPDWTRPERHYAPGEPHAPDPGFHAHDAPLDLEHFAEYPATRGAADPVGWLAHRHG